MEWQRRPTTRRGSSGASPRVDTCAARAYRRPVGLGCGAFENPAPVVAAAYRDALKKENQRHFRVVAFAVFHAGYGPFFPPFATIPASIVTTRKTARPRRRRSDRGAEQEQEQ